MRLLLFLHALRGQSLAVILAESCLNFNTNVPPFLVRFALFGGLFSAPWTWTAGHLTLLKLKLR